ncbi:unnamed protein product [Rotaria sordida]|uniref:Protein kinase domain-containing protein n=1 Tax=Rotaria sordida TaxID=392033 RepID=A0A815LQH0_9BILA|nr:unnamed protein product [Rotaria sordida]CAF1413102.1 unnamed protein product [Rotaria sordida]
MKLNADMEKQLAAQEEANKRQQQATFEQMVAMLLAVAQSKANETVTSDEKFEIQIENTTYEIIQFISRGGFGKIYKAKVRNTGRTVAIKILENTPDIQEEIKNEISFLRLIKRIPIDNHPVIEYRGSKLTEKNIFIAMEFAICDLYTFWKNKTFHETTEQITIFGMVIIVYVLRALAFLEKLNIIHGDIKPQNIVLVPTKQYFCIKLIDFGAAEKMYTQRAQLTVDVDKVHTIFFASPEFLRYDFKNRISRQLHKTSDVWAAGVMFYLLFCGEFPWNDENTYRHFCNDQHAEDVVVPAGGGYRMIIELLLRKNPDERSSAKATLIQLKTHPVFGKIVESLHKSFCPVDDVCHMEVPDDVRQELVKLARPGHYTGGSVSPSGRPSAEKRRTCRYGQKCYKKDADHREKFTHPGDADYHVSEVSDNGFCENRKCRYGVYCYRNDQDHRSKYSHPVNAEHGHMKKQQYAYETDYYRQQNSTQLDENITIKPSIISSIQSMVTLMEEFSSKGRPKSVQPNHLQSLYLQNSNLYTSNSQGASSNDHHSSSYQHSHM